MRKPLDRRRSDTGDSDDEPTVSIAPLPEDVERRPVRLQIPRWKVLVVAATVAVLTTAVVTVLWWVGTRGLTGPDLVQARFEALKVGLSIGVASGGLFALYLAWRRQRSTEADLNNRERALAHQLQVAADTKLYQDRVAADSREDAIARRITELYTKAADQLGSSKGPVRLAGLYALERLAQDNPKQRQTIVSVLCAYLRMPYQLPGEVPGEHVDSEVLLLYQERLQEREVRLAAQRLLRDHLRPGGNPESPNDDFWARINIDLTGAVLIDLDLSRCHVYHTEFSRAQFAGVANFDETYFIEDVSFEDARFTGQALFNNACFDGFAEFNDAHFLEIAGFGGARFNGHVDFDSHFADSAWFREAQFNEVTWFNGVRFFGDAWFGAARFAKDAWFNRAAFAAQGIFNDAEFMDEAHFKDVTFLAVPQFKGARFALVPLELAKLPSEANVSRETNKQQAQ